MRHTAIFRGWRLLALLALLVTGLVSAVLPRGSVQAETSGTLTGQVLTSPFEITAADCNPDGISTFGFRSEGYAYGYYTGSYVETGTLTFGPQTIPVPESVQPPNGQYNFAFDAGPLLTFEATFTITAQHYDPVANSFEAATITGTKRLITSPTAIAACGSAYDKPGYNGGFATFLSQPETLVSFEATIQTPEETFTEQGIAKSSLSALGRTGFLGRHPESTLFESFLTSTRTVGPATLTLSPAAAVNPVGTSHTVTATALNALGQPVQGVTVRFAVSGSTTASGSCTTDANGQCAFTYQGPQLPGADLITAYADTDNDNAFDAGEPVGEATKAWVLPTTTPGQVTGGGQIAATGGLESVTFGFNAQSTANGLKGNCTVIDQATDTKIKCLDVTSLVQAGTHATFFGRAEVNGVPTTYRIDVDDLAEPGKGRDTFKIQTASGYSAGGVLTQGNIQIHKP
jgi:hypothetical protein